MVNPVRWGAVRRSGAHTGVESACELVLAHWTGRCTFDCERSLSFQKEHFPFVRPSPASTLYHPLDEVLGTRALVRVLRVLAGHGGSLAVADIARRAKLTLPSVRSALRRLLALEVATGIGAGRSLVCGLRQDHPLVPVLASLFQAEQEQATAVLGAVRQAAGRLRPAPWAVWLYGSVARGEDDAASDIDIALVTAAPEPGAQADALRDAVARTRATSAERVSVITMGPADVRRAGHEPTPFWAELQRDAVVLLGDSPAGVLERAARAKQR
jgi:predicted nucleotidyltransferase